MNTPTAGRPLLEEALRLFERASPSAEHAAARYDYALSFRRSADKGSHVSALLTRALEIAEVAGATALAPLILTSLAFEACLAGQVGKGQALLDQARTLAHRSRDSWTIVRQANGDCDIQLKLARFDRAAEIAVREIEAVRRAGLEDTWQAGTLAWNTAEALVALGRTGQAAALIDPLTAGWPDLDHWPLHETRAEIDLLRGDIEAAGQRSGQVRACVGQLSQPDSARELAQRAAELALWAGTPGDALRQVERVLTLFPGPDWTIFCGRLLAAGMRACADLAERARARQDVPGTEAAVAAADDLARWVQRMGGAPFADHPFAATIPAERATWEAERTRLVGNSDPVAWDAAAKTWNGLGCPHRAGYAWWRQAQAQLDAGQPATAAAVTLRYAAAAADGHEPLLAQIRALAQRARIALQAPAPVAATPGAPPPGEAHTRYGLTGRELAVLRLLAAGRTNAEIGGELFISPRTAGVHVTNILRKLGVSGRVQAAALAERAGLLETRP